MISNFKVSAIKHRKTSSAHENNSMRLTKPAYENDDACKSIIEKISLDL